MAALQLRSAGSNVLFAAVTEVSDSVLKGAETSGFDGMVLIIRTDALHGWHYIATLPKNYVTKVSPAYAVSQVRGFHQGILKLAMEPSVLGSALLEGGADRVIKLDRSPGFDEVKYMQFQL